MWKVNAGRRSVFAGEFIERGIVAIGWSELGDYTTVRDWEDLFQRLTDTFPAETTRQRQVAAGQTWRFLKEINLGDPVITYDPGLREYHLGEITGQPTYNRSGIDRLPVERKVRWYSSVPRDSLSDSTKGKLGAILTLFKMAKSAERELVSLAAGKPHSLPPETTIEDEEIPDASDPFATLAEQAVERVKDKLLALSWDDMQEIVGALLRALGYRTQISAAGADRGKDIIASRDGFGFERPRIVVEVKHRRGQMGSQEIRSFLGGRHADDRGLYVSTGGFTREARYEAERASTLTHLMSLDELALALIEHYENLDQAGRRLLPMQKIYWPT